MRNSSSIDRTANGVRRDHYQEVTDKNVAAL
jgi:hypothetical protein